MFTRRGSTEVHEFDGKFLGSPAHFRVTSVIGHVFRYLSYLFSRRISLIKISLSTFFFVCLSFEIFYD